MKPIELNVKKDWLPVNLVSEESGEVIDTLRFYYDDNTVKRFQKDTEEIQARIKKLDESKKAQTEKEDAILCEFFDFWLGEGSYEKVKVAQRSIYHRKDMIIDLSLAISNALHEMRAVQEEKQAEFYLVEK